MWFDFDGGSERVHLKSEEIKRVSLGEENCWKDLDEGNPQSRRKKETKPQ